MHFLCFQWRNEKGLEERYLRELVLNIEPSSGDALMGARTHLCFCFFFVQGSFSSNRDNIGCSSNFQSHHF
jgi:hypothetical protein